MKAGTTMTIRNFSYFLKQASRSIVKNRLMSVTSIITVFSSVLILSVAFTIGINLNNFISSIEDSFSFIAFINEDVTPDEVKVALEELRSIPNVSDVQYTSSDEALQEFSESLGEDSNSDIIKGLENDNPLPASFTIYVEDTADMDAVIKEVEKEVGEDKTFSSVKHAQAQLEIFSTVRSAITLISTALVTVLGFIAVVIIMNTIKIAVTSRRVEINIMKYIGATDWFIRWPFVFEGIFIGIMGSFIAVLTTVIVYAQVVPWMSDIMGFVLGGLEFLSPFQITFQILPIALLAGIALGVIGSISSLRAHLKV